MNRQDHADAFGRLCREVENRAWWALWGPVIRTVLAGIGLAGALWLAALSGDCGDIRDAGADPEPAVIPPHPSASQPIPPDPEAFALVARMRAFRPSWPGSDAELAGVAVALVAACAESPWPTRSRCPDLLAALAEYESGWRSRAVGPAPWRARGLLQVHGVARMGWTDAELREPGPGARVGATWLRHLAFACRYYEPRDDYEARVLGAFGGSGCVATRGARRVLRMEREMRAGGGR